MIYCDSSFIVSLYSDEGSLSTAATELAAKWSEAPKLSAYTELEVSNTFLRKIFESPDNEPQIILTRVQDEVNNPWPSTDSFDFVLISSEAWQPLIQL
jgi:hypothetical protein